MDTYIIYKHSLIVGQGRNELQHVGNALDVQLAAITCSVCLGIVTRDRSINCLLGCHTLYKAGFIVNRKAIKIYHLKQLQLYFKSDKDKLIN